MNDINELLQRLNDISTKYGLEIFYLDFTEITLLSRFGLSLDVFIELYANLKKRKLNLALIVSNNRIYGIDKEGGFYHEHPISNPESHVRTEPKDLDEFVEKCCDYLKQLGLI